VFVEAVEVGFGGDEVVAELLISGVFLGDESLSERGPEKRGMIGVSTNYEDEE
jgi:hypothetical protein